MELKRATAKKLPIIAIVEGHFENEDNSNLLIINNEKISRVNIIGICVESNNSNNLILDDGTSKIQIRSFEDQKYIYHIGDILNIIGKPRVYGNDIYITPEIIKKTEDRWMRVRKLELIKFQIPIKKTVENEERLEIKISDKREKIINFIKEKDTGTGVEIENIIKETKIQNSEEIIENMLKEGEAFENSPGKIKLLE